MVHHYGGSNVCVRRILGSHHPSSSSKSSSTTLPYVRIPCVPAYVRGILLCSSYDTRSCVCVGCFQGLQALFEGVAVGSSGVYVHVVQEGMYGVCECVVVLRMGTGHLQECLKNLG
eukprot:TRINITY_DN31919_c0_g1_i1.p1 TRINITY_DN31919_c0_g1~~TRINITY_DN31919_c0_g1_i1.p1  ORF type:complete len:116 (-),score=7.68 TRINITY_DN31919_c0_g1_i1:146-493(-)